MSTREAMNKKIVLPYGETTIEFGFPKEWTVMAELRSSTVPDTDPEKEIARALRTPLESGMIRDIVRRKTRIIIIADDKTRKTPVDIILPYVIREMKEGGIQSDQITLISAIGTHEKMSYPEMQRKYGSDVLKEIDAQNHDCDSNLVKMGSTRRGTPVWINKKVAEGDFILGIGGVGPHSLPGFRGGGKIILPGVAGRKSIGFNHGLITDTNVSMVRQMVIPCLKT